MAMLAPRLAAGNIIMPDGYIEDWILPHDGVALSDGRGG